MWLLSYVIGMVFFICIICSDRIDDFASSLNRKIYIKKTFKVNKSMILQNISKWILIITFVAILITSLILQMMYFLPYEKVAILISAQNVPHTIVMETGYTSLTELQNDTYDSVYEVEKIKEFDIVSKRINTSQLATNIALTTGILTIIYLAIYFLFLYNKEKKKPIITKTEVVEPPYIDFNELAFADPETQEKVQKDYAEAMYRYVKSKLK